MANGQQMTPAEIFKLQMIQAEKSGMSKYASHIKIDEHTNQTSGYDSVLRESIELGGG